MDIKAKRQKRLFELFDQALVYEVLETQRELTEDEAKAFEIINTDIIDLRNIQIAVARRSNKY